MIIWGLFKGDILSLALQLWGCFYVIHYFLDTKRVKNKTTLYMIDNKNVVIVYFF